MSKSKEKRGKTFIVFVVHAHQPFFQFPEVRDAVYEESYMPFLRILEQRPHIRAALSLTKSAGEWLPYEFFEKIRGLASRGQIELLATSAYHYIFPIIPPWAVQKQLNAHRLFLERSLRIPPSSGVFLPELAFSPETATALGYFGFSWTLADDALFGYSRMHLPGHLRVPNDWIPISKTCPVFLRAHDRSEDIARGRYENGRTFLQNLLDGQEAWRDACGNPGTSYTVLAIDLETFGHHEPKDSIDRFLIPFFDGIAEFRDECELVFFSKLLAQFPARAAEIPAGSWATSIADFEHKSYFPLWNHRDNPFHRAWNEFARITFSLAELYPSEELCRMVQKIFASCIPWSYSQGKKELARIPLPLYEKTLSLLPPSEKTERLWSLFTDMDVLTK